MLKLAECLETGIPPLWMILEIAFPFLKLNWEIWKKAGTDFNANNTWLSEEDGPGVGHLTTEFSLDVGHLNGVFGPGVGNLNTSKLKSSNARGVARGGEDVRVSNWSVHKFYRVEETSGLSQKSNQFKEKRAERAFGDFCQTAASTIQWSLIQSPCTN